MGPPSHTARKTPEDQHVGVLALDFDGTIYSGTRPVASELLRRLLIARGSGVKLVLVTGRCLLELGKLVDTALFDAVVAENGAILLAGGDQVNLAPPGWDSVRRRLLRRFRAGKEQVIISLSSRRQGDVMRHLGTGARLEFNKDRLMILPAGVDKGTGLERALGALGAQDERLMCIGDGENDLAMFRIADLRVAVKDSSESLKREADYVTRRNDGDGALEATKTFISEGKR